jgi:hypothetical protein
LAEARESGCPPKAAALNLNPLRASSPDSAWEKGYFSVLDKDVSKEPRAHRGPDHPVKLTVYARVVQWHDTEIEKHPGRDVGVRDPTKSRIEDKETEEPFSRKGRLLVKGEPIQRRVRKAYRSFSTRRQPEQKDRPPLEVGEDEIAIQYWCLYMYNDFLNIHEGDWESITLFLDKEQRPMHAAYASHEGGRRRPWNHVQRKGRRWSEDRGDGEHPVVYVAAGSHGSYFQWPAGEGHMEAEIKLKIGVGRFRAGVRLSKREAFDRIPNSADSEKTVRLGPSDYELVHIPAPRERDSGPEWDRLQYPEPEWAWLNHPRLCWGSRALLDAKGYGGPMGPASEHTEKEPNWRWYNPWVWAYDTCVPDDLVFDPFVPPS